MPSRCAARWEAVEEMLRQVRRAVDVHAAMVMCAVECVGAPETREEKSWLAALGVGGQIFYTDENRPSNTSRRMFWPGSIFPTNTQTPETIAERAR